MKLILLFKFCVKRIIFIMRMIKKINIIYVSGQPNTNTNTKTNGQRNILRWKLTKWMGDHKRWMVANAEKHSIMLSKYSDLWLITQCWMSTAKMPKHLKVWHIERPVLSILLRHILKNYQLFSKSQGPLMHLKCIKEVAWYSDFDSL